MCIIVPCEFIPTSELLPEKTNARYVTCAVANEIYRIYPNSTLGSGSQGFAVTIHLLALNLQERVLPDGQGVTHSLKYV